MPPRWHAGRRLLIGLALLGRAAPAWGDPAAGRPAVVDLAGPWRYLPHEGPADLCSPAIDDGAWATMQLPSSWFLLGRAEYPPGARADQPLTRQVGSSELPAPDPSLGLDHAGTVYFRRDLEWAPGASGAAARALLDLDMVDYLAEVSVNGVVVGRHEGYFQRFSVDATGALRAGRNLLCLKVSAPAQVVDMAQQHAISWPKQQDQIKGVFGYHDARPGGTSARGQARSTGGVLRGVALRRSRGLDLAGLTVTPTDVSEASARLVVEATLRNWGSAPVDAVLEGAIAPRNFRGGAASLPAVRLVARAEPGETRVKGEVKVDRPSLWWTWDRGKPNLYELRARLSAAGVVTDERAVTFGVRSIGRDAGWVVRLNGQRIYLRGTNYIGTQWLSQADRAFSERDLRMMLAANLNAVRVHGHVARPELYELADELGLLVWQDFPLQWGYADLPAVHAEALRQAGDMIEQLRGHPSIFLWCMHNEAPHAMAWMKKRVASQNLALDEALAARAAALDPTRIVLRDSGTEDGHYYFGWYHDTAGALRPLPKYVQPLVSEYGAQALPSRASLERTLEPRALWPQTDDEWEAWRFADFQAQPTFEVARVDRGNDLDEFVARSQAYQAALIRFQTEVFRRAKWTRSTGLFHFMFVDPWPAITWSVVDYFRQPKAGYQALRGAMQRVLPSIDYSIDDPAEPLAIHVINDDAVPYRGARLRWAIVDAAGKPLDKALGRGEHRLDVAADSAALVVTLGTHPEIAAGSARLEVELADARGALLGTSRLTAADYAPRPRH